MSCTSQLSNPICFMIRNRAQKSDMIEQVLQARRAFIGYPPRLKEDVGDTGFHEGLYDISSDLDWYKARENLLPEDPKDKKNYLTQVSGNRNLVKDAVRGSIILVPRPDRGLVYAGTVERFELIDDPLSYAWGKNYIESRFQNKLNKPNDDMASHVQDLAQSFLIQEENWLEIPFVSFPSWMQRTFFGRRTTSRLRAMKIGASTDENLYLAYKAACELMDKTSAGNNVHLIPDWTDDHEDIKQRLRDRVGPESFEHLIVALLQLENTQEQWIQCGGSGDGGIDGLGTSRDGKISLLQCKWEYWSDSFEFGKTIHKTNIKKRYFAYLNGPKEKLNCLNYEKNVCVLDADKIANLVLKHSEKLPMAITLRVCKN